MVVEWKKYRIKDIAESMGDAPFGSSIKTQDYISTGALIIQGKNIKGRTCDWSDRKYVSIKKYQSLPRSHCFPGDLIFPKVGTIGKVGLLTCFDSQEQYLLSTNTMRLHTNENFACRDYVYYYFSSPEIVNLIQSLNSNSVQPVFNFTSLKNFEIVLPPLSEQKAIAHILSSFDDKIELNRQMNETLEAMARAIFKSWFVDFDPVSAKRSGRQPAGMDTATADLFPDEFEESSLGLIPKGWELKSLDEIANFLNGLALQKYPPNSEEYLPVIKIAELRKGITEQSAKASIDIPSDYIVENGDILFSWSGSLVNCIWCGGKGALNQHLFKVTSTKYPKWFYYQWVNYHLPEFQFIAASKATTMGHIQRHHLKEAKVITPSFTLLSSMDKIMNPLFEQVINSNLESHTLATLRDTLLPKLMSGEIRVKEAEKIINDKL